MFRACIMIVEAVLVCTAALFAGCDKHHSAVGRPDQKAGEQDAEVGRRDRKGAEQNAQIGESLFEAKRTKRVAKQEVPPNVITILVRFDGESCVGKRMFPCVEDAANWLSSLTDGELRPGIIVSYEEKAYNPDLSLDAFRRLAVARNVNLYCNGPPTNDDARVHIEPEDGTLEYPFFSFREPVTLWVRSTKSDSAKTANEDTQRVRDEHE